MYPKYIFYLSYPDGNTIFLFAPFCFVQRPKKTLREKRRSVLPGITGLSQINYTGQSRKLDDKVKLDINFIENYNLYNYFKILLNTPIILIIRLLKNKTSIIK